MPLAPINTAITFMEIKPVANFKVVDKIDQEIVDNNFKINTY
jgi:hypothetical protein